MSSQPDRANLPALLRELTTSLVSLRRDLRAEQRREGRGLDRLLRLTTDVTIPATILVLETNIRALRLLQRTLRIVDDTDADKRGATTAGEDVASVGRSVVARLDDALEDVQAAVEGDADARTRDHLADARELNRQLEDRLAELSETEDGSEDERESTSDDRGATVDVEAELRSIKDEHGDSDDNWDEHGDSDDNWDEHGDSDDNWDEHGDSDDDWDEHGDSDDDWDDSDGDDSDT